jgi:GTP-binding protein
VKIEKIEFICSSPSLKFCPKEDLPEFAFIGRSNVGKSSLINMLASFKGLAKVSGTPGKTRLLNHFKVVSSMGADPEARIPDLASRIPHPATNRRSPVARTWFLVDLPGYGFAKLSKTQREKFEGLIRNYLQKRENLALTFLLIDSRLEPQKIDLEFMNWLGDNEAGFIILFTKTDKLSKTQLASNVASYQKALSAYWDELPRIILTSAETKFGREEVLETIENALQEIEAR